MLDSITFLSSSIIYSRMGIIIHDKVKTGYGIDLIDSYASFHGQEVRVTPVDDPKKGKVYHLATRYVVFKDEAACKSGLKPLMTVAFRTITNSTGIKDVFSTLYRSLAEKFDHVDDKA